MLSHEGFSITHGEEFIADFVCIMVFQIMRQSPIRTVNVGHKLGTKKSERW